MNDPVYFRFLQRRFARRQMLIFAGGAGAAAILAGCGGKSSTSADSGASQAPATPAPVRPAGWHDDSHGAEADPDYGMVFPTDNMGHTKVNIIND